MHGVPVRVSGSLRGAFFGKADIYFKGAEDGMYSRLTRQSALCLLAGAGLGFLGTYLRAQSPAADHGIRRESPGAGGPTQRARLPAVDPGVRAGPPGAGGPIQGLTSAESDLFNFV